MIDFLKHNHFLKTLSKNALTKFIISNYGKGFGSMMLNKVKSYRNQVIFRESHPSDSVYIVL
jgi:hypothetical protein